MTLKNENIICFAGEDWWYHNPHSNLHIMKSFAKENRVLFVNSIGVRAPSFKSDRFAGKRILAKLKSMLMYLRKAEKNIFVLTPLSFPIVARFERSIIRFNQFLLICQIRSLIVILNFKKPIVWITLPTVAGAALYLRNKIGKCLVYYCVDNISFFSDADQNIIASLDKDIQKKADVAFFVNHALLEERKQNNANSYYLDHGVDFEHFSAPSDRAPEIPDDIKSIKRPIAGYVGAIKDLDFDLVRYLADQNRDVSFVFIGDIYSEPTDDQSLPNMHFLGKKKYEDLPAYMRAFNVCCLYYKTGDNFNDYRNPKKLLEYLATGIPIVSVSIKEMHSYTDYVYVAKSFEEFNKYLRTSLEEKSSDKKEKRIEFARAKTWDHTAEAAASYISQCLNGDILKHV